MGDSQVPSRRSGVADGSAETSDESVAKRIGSAHPSHASAFGSTITAGVVRRASVKMCAQASCGEREPSATSLEWGLGGGGEGG
jgi:hypothetical protein